MLPVIMPLSIPTAPMTEHQKERRRFAEMEVAFRKRKRHAAMLSLLRAVTALAQRLAHGLARRRGRAAQARRPGRARAAVG